MFSNTNIGNLFLSNSNSDEFSIKPKKTPPFTTLIFYLNEKNKTKIILANHQIESVLGYTFLLLGMIILCVVMFIQLS